LIGDRAGVEAVVHLFDDIEEIGAGPVHLINEGDARYAVAVGLVPNRFALGFDAADGAEDGDDAVEHTQRAFDFHGEIDVPGGVDDVDCGFLPPAGDGGRGDGNAAFLFLLHEIHSGLAVVHFADFSRGAGKEQNPFGYGRFTRIDVRDDADVARFADAHVRFLIFRWRIYAVKKALI